MSVTGDLKIFKRQMNLHNLKRTGESASADDVVSTTHPELLKQAVEEQGYLPQVTFNEDRDRPLIQAREVRCHDTVQSV